MQILTLLEIIVWGAFLWCALFAFFAGRAAYRRATDKRYAAILEMKELVNSVRICHPWGRYLSAALVCAAVLAYLHGFIYF